MTSTSLVAAYPPPPFCANSVQIQAYIEILGLDLTVDFLLAFGGAELHLSRDPKGKSRLSALVGPERAKALGQVTHRLQRRVPLEKPQKFGDRPLSGMERHVRG